MTADRLAEAGRRFKSGDRVTWFSTLNERRYFGHCSGLYCQDGVRACWQVRTCFENGESDGRRMVVVVAEEFLKALP